MKKVKHVELPAPCPFCGSTQVAVRNPYVADSDPPFWVRCEVCQAKGPEGKYKYKAIALWNVAKRSI